MCNSLYDVSIDLYEKRDMIIADTNRVMLCWGCFVTAGGEDGKFVITDDIPFQCIACNDTIEEEFYGLSFVRDDTDECDFIDLCLRCGDEMIGRDFFIYRKK